MRAETCIRVAMQLHCGSPRDAVCADRRCAAEEVAAPPPAVVRKETSVRISGSGRQPARGRITACEWRVVWEEVSKPVLAHVTIGVVSLDAGPAARVLVLARMPPTARSAA
jgi:hypothetical protein